MQCTAHNRQGSQCGNDAMKGGNVCRMHGGSAPQVKAAAQRRLLEAVDPVLSELIQLALHEEDPKVRLAACRDILDRVGLMEPRQAIVELIPDLNLVNQWIEALEADLAANG